MYELLDYLPVNEPLMWRFGWFIVWITLTLGLLIWWRLRLRVVGGPRVLGVVTLLLLITTIEWYRFACFLNIDGISPWLLLARTALILLLAHQLWQLLKHLSRVRFPDVSGVKFYLVSAIIVAVVLKVAHAPHLTHLFKRLGWEFGRYHHLPFPYSFASHHTLAYNSGRLIHAIHANAFRALLAVTFVHTVMYLLCVTAYRIRGWPYAWSDIRKRVRLSSCWADAARRSWWIAPAMMLAWQFWRKLSNGMRMAGTPMINLSPVVLAAYLLLTAGMYLAVTAVCIRRRVDAAFGDEECYCNACGYHLHGIQSVQCPECGGDIEENGRTRYRLGGPRGANADRWGSRRRYVFATLALTIPMWLTPLMLLVPVKQRPSIPFVLGFPVNDFPLRWFLVTARLDAVTTLTDRSGERVTVVPEYLRESEGGNGTVWLHVGYWTNPKTPGSDKPRNARPDRVEKLLLYVKPNVSGTTFLNLGGSRIRASRSVYRSNGNTFWISSQNTSLKVASELKQDYKGDLSWMPDESHEEE